MTCLVKDKGKKCKRKAGTRGQCSYHYFKFRNMVNQGKMTWEFLELAGEAIPIDWEKRNQNLLNCNKKRKIK